MNIDQNTLLNPTTIHLFIKIAILIIMGIIIISAAMFATKIKSFNKVLFLPKNSGGNFMQRLAIFYFIMTCILFLVTLIVL